MAGLLMKCADGTRIFNPPKPTPSSTGGCESRANTPAAKETARARRDSRTGINWGHCLAADASELGTVNRLPDTARGAAAKSLRCLNWPKSFQAYPASSALEGRVQPTSPRSTCDVTSASIRHRTWRYVLAVPSSSKALTQTATQVDGSPATPGRYDAERSECSLQANRSALAVLEVRMLGGTSVVRNSALSRR